MKSLIGALTELGLMLLALGIVCALLVGGQNLPFFGNVAGNITAFVKDLGSIPLAKLSGRDLDAWYGAFDVHEGEALFLPKGDRVRVG